MVKRLLIALAVAMTMVTAAVDFASAQPVPVFKLGFKTLADQILQIVGQPIENEHWSANGDSLQQTTTGLMVWRKADNWTAFTNGSLTWVDGPYGIQTRVNDVRFGWELGLTPPNDLFKAPAPQVEPEPTLMPHKGTTYAPVIINGAQAYDLLGGYDLVWKNGQPCQDPAKGGTNCYIGPTAPVKAGGQLYYYGGANGWVSMSMIAAGPSATPAPTATQRTTPPMVQPTPSQPVLFQRNYELIGALGQTVTLQRSRVSPSTETFGPVLNLAFTEADRGNLLTVVVAQVSSETGTLLGLVTPDLYESFVGPIVGGQSVLVQGTTGQVDAARQDVLTESNSPGQLQWEVHPGNFFLFFPMRSMGTVGLPPQERVYKVNFWVTIQSHE